MAAAVVEGPVIDLDQLRAYLDRESRMWGMLVRSRREMLGFTLEQVATLAGTTVPTLFKIEKGKIQPRDHLRVALAFALQTEVLHLFPIPDRKTIVAELAKAS